MNQVTKLQTPSAPVDTFAEALVKVQGAIKTAIKDATNPAFRSKYADLGAVWEAVKPALQDNGFAVVQSPQFEGETMWLETTLLHVTGERMTGRYPIRPDKNTPQGVGSAITYARRYSISAMLGVVADEDDDGNAASGVAAPSKAAPPPKHEPMSDPDVVEGVKNWCEQQKDIISNAKMLPDLTDWLDTHGGNWVSPATSSALYRLRKAAPTAFNDLKTYYMDRLTKI